MSRLRTTLLQATVLVTLAACLAAADRAVRPPAPPGSAPYAVIDTQAALAAHAAGEAVFVDARSAASFRAGHILGAFHLDVHGDFEAGYAALVATVPSPDRFIVTYCDGKACKRSRELAEALIGRGYSRVQVYVAGWPEWTAAGGPVAEGPQ